MLYTVLSESIGAVRMGCSLCSVQSAPAAPLSQPAAGEPRSAGDAAPTANLEYAVAIVVWSQCRRTHLELTVDQPPCGTGYRAYTRARAPPPSTVRGQHMRRFLCSAVVEVAPQHSATTSVLPTAEAKAALHCKQNAVDTALTQVPAVAMKAVARPSSAPHRNGGSARVNAEVH